MNGRDRRRSPLPIDDLLPEIVAALRTGTSLVVEAPPGAGKTTRVPLALLEGGGLDPGEVLVLQPRRLPARLLARHVAAEMGEPLGETVGYTVRFEDVSGPRTRLRFITEGLLLRRLLSHPTLEGVSAVVLDEFHERHLHTDLGLALLHRLQESRPDLRLVVMSATLDPGPVRDYLGGCPGLRSEGRLYPIEREHLSTPDARPLAEQVAGSVRRYLREGGTGDILVFLPGAAEIRRCAEALTPLQGAHDLLVLPLHGELSPAEQARAVEPASRRKVILSTNVAETSLTIDGVAAVVDSGLARLAAHSSWTGLPTLGVGKISQASAEQRAGRAGRTGPGRALRLYTRHDLDSRRAYDLPEIARLDLAEPLLTLHGLGIRSPASFAWFEPPPPAALAAAEQLLSRLEAIDGAGTLTETGRSMLRFPLHPRLARLLVEAERRGVAEEGAALCALISERDIEERARLVLRGSSGPDGYDEMDLLGRLDRFRQAAERRFSGDALRSLGLDRRAVEAVERARGQLASQIRSKRGARPAGRDEVDRALAICTLSAFPDRVARRRVPAGRDAVLAGGGSARVGLSPPGSLLVAVDAEERPGAGGRGRGVVVRLAAEIEPDWLIEAAASGLREENRMAFHPETERIESTSTLAYGEIVLDETRRPAAPSPDAGQLLAAAARSLGWSRLLGEDRLADLLARLELLGSCFPESGVPPDRAALETALEQACLERVAFAELREAGLEGLLAERFPPALWQRLRQETPLRLRLPGGREVPVHYQSGQPPWLESRLQDFFGLQAGPSVCSGRAPLVLHLLAPSGRAVQVTRDLAGFWRQHYPAIRRELSRRYPRHPWPEDGATATPPAPRRR